MKHEFVIDKSVNITELDGIVKVEVCKYCDVRRWTWTKKFKDGSSKDYQYMFSGDTQYWNEYEECKDTYCLFKLQNKKNEDKEQLEISF